MAGKPPDERFIRQVSSLELPVDDTKAIWGTLCDRAFQTLQGAVADEVHGADILAQIPAMLDRSEFEAAVQGMTPSQRQVGTSFGL